MLPEVLSNKVCSLNLESLKNCFSIIMEIDNNGKVVNKSIFESIIKSSARLTYNEVYEWKEKSKYTNNIKKWSKIEKTLINSIELDNILQKSYKDIWMIDFHSNEINIELDDKLNPVNIYKRKSNFAHKLIETFMVTANTEISDLMFSNNLPCIYRSHDEPDSEAIDNINIILWSHWFEQIPDSKTPLDIQRTVNQIKWTDYYFLVSDMLVKAMSKAIYTHDKPWHFGLALWVYSHFTSPIRRYADLVLHRLIKEFYLWDAKKSLLIKNKIKDIASHITEQELLFVKTERTIQKIFCIEYMKDKKNIKYEAVISWFNDRWIFVMLSNWIEWFIWKNDLNWYEIINSWNIKKKEDMKSLWDKIDVKCIKTDIEKMFLDFKIV